MGKKIKSNTLLKRYLHSIVFSWNDRLHIRVQDGWPIERVDELIHPCFNGGVGTNIYLSRPPSPSLLSRVVYVAIRVQETLSQILVHVIYDWTIWADVKRHSIIRRVQSSNHSHYHYLHSIIPTLYAEECIEHRTININNDYKLSDVHCIIACLKWGIRLQTIASYNTLFPNSLIPSAHQSNLLGRQPRGLQYRWAIHHWFVDRNTTPIKILV